MVSDLTERLEEMRVKGRDIYEVANQLGGYVGPDTEKHLADFLIREANAASDLADEIVRLTAALAEAREKALEEAMLTALRFAQEKQKHWDDDLGEYVMRKSSDAHAIVAAIRALKEKP